jgi:hypothetical protein
VVEADAALDHDKENAMTAVDVEPRQQPGIRVPLQPQISEAEARRMTDQVRADFAVLWNRVLDLYEQGAHLALNYTSWGEYWRSEFGVSGARGEQLVRAGRVARALREAGLPMPANDATARTLLPVLRMAPEELPKVWRAALAAHESPTQRQLKPLVEPYRVARGVQGDEVKAKRASTKIARNRVRHALDDARGAAEAAISSIEEALATDPSDAQIDEWRESAKVCAQRFMELASKLRA